ncbi:hypothetical protein EVAR_71867_1 [Eumeta japonica]|uniref:ATP-dependent DNA helicase n=1 Tax=Eumeta variegata TaxID=151549 RepID=A0A4C1SSI9_EUMVA|nr:hypothetical protein EVAR_71867_1 [Eumeta japonica]
MTAADEINACLKSSNLWHNVKKFQLVANMRVALLNDPSAEDFCKQLLTIGNGRVPVNKSSRLISLSPIFCNFVASKNELIENVFPNMIANHENKEWLCERAILAAKNKDVDDLYFAILNVIVGHLHSFKSVDSVTNEDEATNYPTEFLNSLDVPGLPQRNLQLKGSVPQKEKTEPLYRITLSVCPSVRPSVKTLFSGTRGGYTPYNVLLTHSHMLEDKEKRQLICVLAQPDDHDRRSRDPSRRTHSSTVP